MMIVADNTQNNWRKNPMVWMVIFFPTLAVVAGFITLFLAINTDDGLVVDDYYKKGLQINLVLERDQVALKKNIAAELALNTLSGELNLLLTAQNNYHLPQNVKILLTHRTRSGLDQSTQLQLVQENQYRGYLKPPVITGRWSIEIASDKWRLKTKFQTSSDSLVNINLPAK